MGGLSYGVGFAVEQSGIASNFVTKIGISNSTAANIVGSTINGTIAGGITGIWYGVGMYAITGKDNVLEHAWKGAMYGGLGSALSAGLTEAGYKAQLYFGRKRALNSKVTSQLANGGKELTQEYGRSTVHRSNSDILQSDYSSNGYGDIRIEYNTNTGKTTVNGNFFSDYWIAPSPYTTVSGVKIYKLD